MMRHLLPQATKQTRSFVMAVVLGTAVSITPSRAAGTTTTKLQQRAAEAHDPPLETIDAMARYCQACWRNARVPFDRWGDCTQQVFVRLLERVSISRWAYVFEDETEDRKEFVRAIDAVRKRSQRVRQFSDVHTTDAADVRPEADCHRLEAWEAVAAAANEVLSPRQFKIVELAADGWGVPEIANELGTTPERISDEKYKAIRKLRDRLGVEG